MIENLNPKYFTAFASKTFSSMEKVIRIGTNFDEAFKREKSVEDTKTYTSNNRFIPRKPKTEVNYVANAWAEPRREHERSKGESRRFNSFKN